MTKSFRPWKVDEVWLLPPSVQEFVPEGHPAHLVRDIVAEELDLSAILSTYTELRGYPPYHPAMMVALLLYAYSRGVYSSRRIARACEERLDFQAVTALNRPDFRTISEFRRRHLAALAELFVQVLALCRRAGLVGLTHVAVDGTKLRANASKHKAMSYGRMGLVEAALAAEVEGWLAQAENTDAAEDAALGADRRGDEMPAWMRDKQRRLQRIRVAKAELEAEAQAAAAAKPDPGTKTDGSPRGRRGRKPQHPPGEPKPSAQRNFTDPESRIMKGRDGFVQAYNAQAAVDAKAQVIVAHHLTNNASDQDALGPLLEAVTANTEATPAEVSADSGYCSEANLADLARRGIRGYVATGRAKHPDGGEDRRRGPLVLAMRQRLRRAGRRSRYRLRKQVVEPVFGQIKAARRFQQVLLRGIQKVKYEWALICTAHNLTKLARTAAA
ncbi:IS1182 family transposase [Roseomonas mucosa]|uniref:IS1182 family transposase n=1 Tax=Roseomonas mucosa TaxID=207340 RepID=UPI002B41529E|nr:IS1182 family transposase [Roseomonas mucosa]QDD97190.1 Transposase [Roseomonas mucosa]